MPELGPVHAAVAMVALLRALELAFAARNTRRLLAAGAVEHGRGHYPLFVLLHAAWLASLALFVPAERPADWPLIGAFVALQGVRLWIIASLGPLWTTRVITLGGAPLVASGPYRYMRHPNYAVVAAEIAILPLAFGAWPIAAAFTVLNVALLWRRIAVEERALGPRRAGAG